MAHFFTSESGSKIHQRVVHFFIDIHNGPFPEYLGYCFPLCGHFFPIDAHTTPPPAYIKKEKLPEKVASFCC